MAATLNSNEAPWWQGAVIYQIYPRSFNDTNNDGIGDLPGIIEKLPYIQSLGVDGIWISPFFVSPMKDFGYDVADYCDVDPMFGELSDFKRLIDVAHKRDLKVIIDQVYSHTSDQHKWFKQSRKNQSNTKADWYVWADAKQDGTPPNNWQSVFGGASWTWDNLRKQYYLHNFLASQPDLNLHNTEVQDALIDAARFWLDLGVDGFRLDAINYGMHDIEFKDNPVNETVSYEHQRPYTMQQQTYNMSHPNMPAFLQRFRQAINAYGDVFTVAEVGGGNPTPVMKQYTQGRNRLSSAYSFEFLTLAQLHKIDLELALNRWTNDATEGWPSWAFSNHDAPRVISRWGSTDKQHKPDSLSSDEASNTIEQKAALYLAILLCLRGNIFIYQGEELGLEQANIQFDELQDPEAIANWPYSLGRDGARTPMPWHASEQHLGFSEAKPWLPVSQLHTAKTVSHQSQDQHSVLNVFKQLVSLRNSHSVLKTGNFILLNSGSPLVEFIRQDKKDRLLCVFNLTASTQVIEQAQDASWELLMGSASEPTNKSTEIQPFSYAIYKDNSLLQS